MPPSILPVLTQSCTVMLFLFFWLNHSLLIGNGDPSVYFTVYWSNMPISHFVFFKVFQDVFPIINCSFKKKEYGYDYGTALK